MYFKKNQKGNKGSETCTAPKSDSCIAGFVSAYILKKAATFFV